MRQRSTGGEPHFEPVPAAEVAAAWVARARAAQAQREAAARDAAAAGSDGDHQRVDPGDTPVGDHQRRWLAGVDPDTRVTARRWGLLGAAACVAGVVSIWLTVTIAATGRGH